MRRIVVEPLSSSSSSSSPSPRNYKELHTPPISIPHMPPFIPTKSDPYQSRGKQQHPPPHYERMEPYLEPKSHPRTIMIEEDEDEDKNVREEDTLGTTLPSPSPPPPTFTYVRKEPPPKVKEEKEEEQDPIKRMWNIYYESMTLGQTWENLVLFYKDKMWEFDEKRLKEYNLSEIRDVKIARTAVIRLLRKLSEDTNIAEDAEIITTSSIIDECVPFEKICKRQILSVL